MNQFIGVNSLRDGPDGRGRFGEFGGRFVAETLMSPGVGSFIWAPISPYPRGRAQ